MSRNPRPPRTVAPRPNASFPRLVERRPIAPSHFSVAFGWIVWVGLGLLAMPWVAIGRSSGGSGDALLLFADVTAQLPADSDNSNAVALVDVDGDFDLDAYVGNGGAPDVLYANDGAGNFTDASSQIPGSPNNASDVTFGDVDGDLDPDLVIAAGSSQQNRLLENDGTGTFTDATSQIPAILDSTEAVLLVDVDGDLDLDLVSANAGEASRLALNDGLGIFTDASSQVPVDTTNTLDAIAFDADGDADIDLLFGNNAQQNVLWLNDGAGTFADATANLPVATSATIAVLAADVDGDLDLDVVTANKGQQNRLATNDGSGTFTDAAAALPADNDASHAVVAGDWDGDADLDLLFGNALQPELLYENDGAGTFTDSSSQVPAIPDWTEDVQSGDVDGDGDLDLYLAVRFFQGSGTDHLLRNDSLPDPDLTSITPTSGFVAGGDAVTLGGNGFQNGVVPGSTVVTLGGVAATNVMVVDDATVTADTPSVALPGAVDVTLSNSTGTDTLPSAFTYVAAPPDLVSLMPTSGPVTGGTVVALSGTGFQVGVAPGSTTVTFGGAGAMGVTVDSDVQITATTPASVLDGTAPGPVDVVVTNSNGSDTLTDAFTYYDPVLVASVIPGTGVVAGGDSVTIAGTGFLIGVVPGSTTVDFGGVPATAFTVDGDTQITATTPAGAGPGPVDVSVTNSNGADTLGGGYTYVAPLAIATIVPSVGPLTGGTPVTITGAGFFHGVPAGTLTVDFGGIAAGSVTVLSDGALTASTPAAAGSGPVDVTITTPNGSITATGGFTYVAPVTLTQVTPTSGALSGGDTITLDGSGFLWGVNPGSTVVTFGGVPATGLTVLSDAQMTVVSPAGPGVGTFDVVLTNSLGGATLPAAFTYVPNPPTVVSLLPFTGPKAGGTSVVVTGSGYQIGVPPGTTTVTFDGVPAPFVNVVSDQTIVVLTPPGNVQGGVDVTVTNPNGSATKLGGYTYGPALRLSGPPQIGTTVQTNLYDQTGNTYVSWMGLRQLTVPITIGTFQGAFCLDPGLPILNTCSGVLTTNATPCTILPIPNNPNLIGFTLFQQALTGPNLFGGVATFTNCLQITIQ